jgi:Fic family protein
MRSLNLNYLESIRLSPSQATTLKKIGEYKGKQALFARQTPEILQTLRQLAKVESSESSNRIEGVVAPHHRVKALVLESTRPENRSEQEIAGYRDALSLIHDSAEYMALSISTIQQMHSMIYSYLPDEGGKWKRKDNEIVDIMPDGTRKLRFEPVSASETPETMETFVQNYARAIDHENIEPLAMVASQD